MTALHASIKVIPMSRIARSKRLTDRPLTRPLLRTLLTLLGAAVIATALIASCSPKPSSSAPVSSPSVSAPQAPPSNGVKPTIVLVHGAWADASSWDGEVDALQKQGYDVRAIANPLEDLTTDAESVSSFLKTIDGPVVLVGHSYGGSVITNAAEGNPNVKALVYVDAAAPDVGETNGSLSGADSALHKQPENRPVRQGSVPRRTSGRRRPLSEEGHLPAALRQRPARRPGHPALGDATGGVDGGLRHPIQVRRVEDDPVVVLHQQRRPDHHAHIGEGHGGNEPSRR